MQHFNIKQGINSSILKRERSYKEIVSILDKRWNISGKTKILKIKDKLQLSKPRYSTILIAGTTGKSTTIYYLSKLLSTEGISFCSYSSPHYENYNERLNCNNQTISNKLFSKFGNIILNLIEAENIEASSEDILIGMSLLYFDSKQIEYAIVEQETTTSGCSKIYNPKIIGITRIISENLDKNKKIASKITQYIQPKTLIICSDRSKFLLNQIKANVKEKDGNWAMPVRKAAPLQYPFEQLYGKSAALAERIAENIINNIKEKSKNSYVGKIAFQEKVDRGYPNASKTKKSQILTLNKFWNNTSNDIPNHFEIIKTKTKTIILDGGSNPESIEKTLLGARLLDYKKPFKKIHILLGLYQENLNIKETMKPIRYHMKIKNSDLSFCAVSSDVTEQAGTAAKLSDLDMAATTVKINCSTFKNFESAYKKISKELKSTEELLIIAGSQAIIAKFKKIFEKE